MDDGGGQKKLRIATVLSLKGRFFDCGECRKAGLHRQRHCPEIENETWLIPDAALFDIDGEPVYACPVGQIDRRIVNRAFELVNHYERGFLPFAGGIYDQPNKMLQMIETVRQAKAEAEQAKG